MFKLKKILFGFYGEKYFVSIKFRKKILQQILHKFLFKLIQWIILKAICPDNYLYFLFENQVEKSSANISCYNKVLNSSKTLLTVISVVA